MEEQINKDDDDLILVYKFQLFTTKVKYRVKKKVHY
jgi:hypothetical protein